MEHRILKMLVTLWNSDPVVYYTLKVIDELLDPKGKVTMRSLMKKIELDKRFVLESMRLMTAARLCTTDADENWWFMDDMAMGEVSKWLRSTAITDNNLKNLYKCTLQRVRNEITALDYADLHHYGLYRRELMQSFNPQYADNLFDLIRDTFKGTEIDLLDFGTGDGSLLIEMAKKAPNMSCTGFDINEIQLISAKESKEKENVPNVEFVSKLPSGKYKVILMMQVLHDTQEPKETLEYLKSLLDEDGIMILVDPMVSRNMEMNQGEEHAVTALSHSCVQSVLTNNCPHPPGVSFGIEGKIEAVLEAGLGVLSHGTLSSNKMFYYFVVEKFKSVKEILKDTLFIECGLHTLALDLKTLKIKKLKK